MKDSTAKRLRQIPAGYLLVGIDPHKKKHAAVAMTQDATVRNKFKFDNTRQGYEDALQRLRTQMVRNECRGIIFAIETGGHYWRNLAYFLDESGIPFRLIHPFTLKRRREGDDVNRRKNDFRDAEMAAELLRTGKFIETKLPQGVYAELRAAYSAYRRLVKERSRITNLLKGLLDGLFPEFTSVFKDPCAHTALTVLSVCSVPGVIAKMTEEDFVDAVKAEHPKERRLMRMKLRALYHAAQTSVGVAPGATSVSAEVSFLVEKLCLIREQVGRMVERLIRLVDSAEESKYLLSIRGINYLSVAGLLAELGSFGSYQSAKQLIKMAGTNPTESESAGRRGSRTPMSKKGRSGLRYCAWSAVIPMLRHNSDFRAWAKRLRERPVHANPLNGKEIVGAAVNKLLRLAFALVKKQAIYQMPQLAEVAS